MRVRLSGRDGAPRILDVRIDGCTARISEGDDTTTVELLRRSPERVTFVAGGRVHDFRARLSADQVRIAQGGDEILFRRDEEHAETASGATLERTLRATVPGRVTDVKVTAGDQVHPGDVLLVIEAMKMENPVRAEADGVVTDVWVQTGELITDGQDLLSCDWTAGG